MSSTKTKLLVANWKAKLARPDVERWMNSFSQQELRSNREYVLCPPQPFLAALPATSTQFSLGAQDVSSFEAGAYTGESSAFALESLGVKYAIIGHSERRKYFHETSYEVAKKAELALSFEITPIICFDIEEFSPQIQELTASQIKRSIFAYEPVHAISSFGGVEDPIEITLKYIKQLRELVGEEARVLYGGSVDLENSFTYLQQDSIDGALVGKASLDATIFARL